MKRVIFTFCLVLTFSGLFSQIVDEDFESYTTGNGVAEEAGAPWTTWGNSPGSAEDPVISETVANGGIKSAYVSGTNDGVLEFEDLVSGRYRVDFYLYVESGKTAYFNLLQDFAGSSSEWGTQIFFRTDGTGSLDAGGGDAATFDYIQDTWLHLRIFVDIDNDFATIMLDDNELVSWQWSTGAFGGGSLNKLDAVNFYAWADEGTPGYYFDDVSVYTLSTLDAPQNLTVSLTDDDIHVSWEEPSAGTPDSYILVRNGQEIASGLTETSYDDLDLYPGPYTYSVRAFYDDEGYSPASNEDTDTVAGGVARDLIVYEIGTGTWCQYCPGAAMGADDMVENGYDVAIVEYHSGDSYENTYSLGRIGYYGISGYPTTHVDGVISHVGGSQTVSLYPAYYNYYNNRVNIPSVHSLNMEVTHTGDYNFDVDVDVTEEYEYFTGDIKLHVALTESHIQENWYGMTEVNFYCFEMLPDEDGTVLDFSVDPTQNVILDFSIDTVTQVTDNCEVVAFIQDDDSKEIINAIKIDMEDVSVIGIENADNQDIKIYPNPADEYINIKGLIDAEFVIHDISGKIIYSNISENLEHAIDISSFAEGVYFIKINHSGESISKKFVIIR